jgi:hypothetical protein
MLHFITLFDNSGNLDYPETFKDKVGVTEWLVSQLGVVILHYNL